MTRRATLLFTMLLVTTLSACLSSSQSLTQAEPIFLATTTSTYDSGLLDYLLPFFTKETGIKVNVIAVGTGQALELGRRGDADVLLVHAPEDEELFISEGYGIERRCLMVNSFVILGPEDDPAAIAGEGAADAFNMIASSRSVFVSRGDSSGTHKKELKIWNKTGIVPSGEWYVESGVGMGQSLLLANEIDGYILSDEATYQSMRNSLKLVVLAKGDTPLTNPYSVIAVNPKINPGVNSVGAAIFIDWVLNEKTQEFISLYSRNGHVFFKPLNGICSER